nr:MAG TPA: hypothetical protein [Caudoviricetes sp.]
MYVNPNYYDIYELIDYNDSEDSRRITVIFKMVSIFRMVIT